jgi:hypothetical protein
MTAPVPYGANQNTDRWMTIRNLRYRPLGRCLHWVSRGRCGVRLCNEGHGSYQWMDHVSGWLDKDGERMLLCQPYHLSEIRSLVEACEKFDLRADIHGTGWYGHGSFAIELRPRNGAMAR